MRKLILITALSVFIVCPACIASPDDEPAFRSGSHYYKVVQVPNPNPAAKISFAEKHPRLHKIGRCIRRTCQILLPIAEFGGAVGQIVVALR